MRHVDLWNAFEGLWHPGWETRWFGSRLGGWLQQFRVQLNPYIGFLWACSHARAVPFEGKFHCPDCGKGVIGKWAQLRCVHCYQKRNSYYLFRHIHPQERCCPQCGERLVILEYLENPAYYQLHQARFILYDEIEYLLLLERNRLEQVEAWVETHQRRERTPASRSASKYTSPPKQILALPQ